MLGVSIGTVTEMNCLHCPAPSSCAASYSSVGMFCRPADRMIRLKPRADHSPIAPNAASEYPGVEIQCGPSIPKAGRQVFKIHKYQLTLVRHHWPTAYGQATS